IAIFNMSLFRKPKRNFRKKIEVIDSDEENSTVADDGATPEESNGTNINDIASEIKEKKKKKKKEKEKLDKKNPVSFHHHDEEEEEEVFKIKKSSHSKRIAKQLKRETKKEKEEKEKVNTQVSATGAYSLENIQKLKGEQNGTKEQDFGPRIRTPSPFSGDSEDEKVQPPKGPTFNDVLEAGVIPDAKMIHLARKKRQQARELGGEFIPLEDTEKVEKDNSRLIREDDNDLSEDEERVSMSLKKDRDQERRRIHDTIMMAEEGSDESDHDHDQWIEQQIRKGTSIPKVLTSQPGPCPTMPDSNAYSAFNTQRPPGIFTNQPSTDYAPQPGSIEAIPMDVDTSAAKGPSEADLPTLSVAQIRNKLKERLDNLGQVHRVHLHERDDMEERLEETQTSITKMDGNVQNLENQYRFYQEMRGYVRDIVECFNEKVPQIQGLEQAMMTMLKEQAEKLVKRRQQDIKDESDIYSSSKAVSAPHLTGNIQELSENKKRRAAEREARRARRRHARQRNDLSSASNHRDGMSTDDEDNHGDAGRFSAEKERIMEESKKIFEDVMDDFYKFKPMKSRFERWKYEYGDSYTEAYISLCLPKLFTPLVRLNLIHWSPLDATCRNFEEMGWYEALMFFGFREGVETPSDEQDMKLVPSIIEKVIMSKITEYVSGVWDPLSTSQTVQLVSVVRNISEEYPTASGENKNAQTLYRSVVQRIRKSLDEDVFMPLYPKTMLENRMSGASVFFHRQFWSLIKLMGNILCWQGILSTELVQELSLYGVLNRYLLLAFANSEVNQESLEKCQQICVMFPKDWFVDLQGDSTLPQLENLCRYIVTAVTSLLQNNENDKNRDLIRQYTKILVNIHAMDHASGLATRVGLR
ncbi:unnamed protein product, partial [Owenia fusiformis]